MDLRGGAREGRRWELGRSRGRSGVGAAVGEVEVARPWQKWVAAVGVGGALKVGRAVESGVVPAEDGRGQGKVGRGPERRNAAGLLPT
jgi:hypothetical protein